MTLIQTTGTIHSITTLSPTAKEIVLKTEQPLTIVAGQFINLFVEADGETHRRAYSIASAPGTTDTFSLAIRNNPHGKISKLFFEETDTELKKRTFKIMGPLGMNTENKITQDTVYLCGFGIGVSVVKAMTLGLLAREHPPVIHVLLGCRNRADMMYKDFFENLADKNKITIRYTIADDEGAAYPFVGYVQQHINDYDFNNALVYACGQEIACASLQQAIQEKTDTAQFMIEAFH